MTDFFHWALSSRFIHVVACIKYIIPLHCQKYSIVYSILFIHKHFVYTFIGWWTFWFPHFSYCEHVYVSFGADMCFHLSWLYTKEWHWWAIWWLCLTFSGSARLFPKVTAQFCILTSSVTSIPISSQPHQHLLSFLL